MHDLHLANTALWVSVATVIFLALVLRPLIRFVTQMLDKRTEQISEELERAMALREEAQVILAQYQKKQRESMKEAEEIIQKANLEARRITKEAEVNAEEALKKRMKLAMDKIEQAERHALQEVQGHVIDITIAAARKILAEKLDTNARNELLNQATQDIREKLH